MRNSAACIRRPTLLLTALAVAAALLLLLLAGGGGRVAAAAPATESARPAGHCKAVGLRWPPWLGRALFPAVALPLLLAGPGCHGGGGEPASAVAPAPAPPAVRIGGGAAVPVELALTGAQRSRGLSGRESLAAGSGMLFVFEQPNKSGFWMPEMRFSLDIIWIGADCRLVHIAADVPHPAPDTPRSELPIYAPDAPGQYVLEVNAGDAARSGWQTGDAATFSGPGLEDTGCYGTGE